MLGNRLGNLRWLSRRTGIIPAHHALQFREFAHHPTRQISLGQPRGTCGERRIGAHHRRNQPSQPLQPPHPLPLRPQLGVKHHPIQLGQQILQRRLQILVPEEPRIGEPRPQHPLIPRHQRRAAIAGGNIRQQGEAWCRAPIREAQGKIALVDPHRGAHHLGRQIHEGRINAAQQRHRPFHQPRHLGQQPLIGHHFQPLGGGQRGHAVADHAQPLGGIDQHEMVAQLRQIICMAAHREAAGRVHAVALGLIAAGQAMGGILAAGQGEGHHGAVQQAQNALQRSHPGEGGDAPAHAFRPWEVPQHIRQRLGGQRCSLDARTRLHQHPEIAGLGQRLALHAVFFQEACQRGFGGGDARPALLLRRRLGPGLDFHHQPDAARPGKSARCAHGDRRQGRAHQPAQILCRPRLHPRGDFLGQQFQQQFGH